MAYPYFDQLNTLVEKCNLDEEWHGTLEVKHFFSGAALYSEGHICASLSPLGLAFKLGELKSEKLINSGKAVPLKYFKKGNVKSGYAMFETPSLNKLRVGKVI